MRRALPVYLVLLGIANGLIAWFGGLLAQALRLAYAELLEGHLPAITLYALPLPSVFYVVGFIALVIGWLTWKEMISPSAALHSTAGVVALDGVLLILALLGYVTPLITLTTVL